MATIPDPNSGMQVLNSWKEIASYMNRGVRTIQRWESELQLPIRRPHGRRRSAVVAIPAELDEWLKQTPLIAIKIMTVETDTVEIEPIAMGYCPDSISISLLEQKARWAELSAEFHQTRSAMRETSNELRLRVAELTDTMARLRLTRDGIGESITTEA